MLPPHQTHSSHFQRSVSNETEGKKKLHLKKCHVHTAYREIKKNTIKKIYNNNNSPWKLNPRGGKSDPKWVIISQLIQNPFLPQSSQKLRTLPPAEIYTATLTWTNALLQTKRSDINTQTNIIMYIHWDHPVSILKRWWGRTREECCRSSSMYKAG